MPMTARVKYFGTFVKCGVLVDYMIRLPDTKPTALGYWIVKGSMIQVIKSCPDAGLGP